MERITLQKLNWNSFNYERLNAWIKKHANKGNYAVFDWDYTCIFYDAQDSLFMYQIDNLLFKLTPSEFLNMLKHSVPQDVKSGVKNLAGIDLTARDLTEDIVTLYTWLYENYKGFNGSLGLDEIRKTAEFMDFKVKMIVLMYVSVYVGGFDLAQRVSTGFPLEEYKKLSVESIDFWLKAELKVEHYVSRDWGKAGACAIDFRTGMRLQPEIQNLMSVLNANGIDTYVCSASQKENIQIFANTPKYGYNVKWDNVFGQTRLLDSNNCFLVESNPNFCPTNRQHKAETIQQYIMPKHNGKPPILVAGDSDGDFYMMDAFKESAMILICERLYSTPQKIDAFREKAGAMRGNTDAQILVQARDNSTGLFCDEK